MYRIIDKKDCGKTSRLMLLVKENKGTLVCENPNAMEVKAHNYGIFGLNIVSYQEFLVNKNNHYWKVYIDELDKFLKFAFENYCVVDGYTLSIEE